MDDDDRALGDVLRQHAERMTDDVTDASAAFDVVVRRARTRRRRWVSATAGLTAAAAAVGVLVVAGATGERATVRTPATSPTALPTIATSTVPSTVPVSAPSTVPARPLPATSTIATAPPSTESTETFSGIGGSITVRLGGNSIRLAVDPSAAPGFTTRIDDDGPDRVRVRFEREDERTEIRVELQDGALVPTIQED